MDPQFPLFLLLIAAGIIGFKTRPVVGAWRRAKEAGAPVSLLSFWVMYFRNVPLDALVDAHIHARRAGVAIPLDDLQRHALAGGDILAVVRAYVETLEAGTEIDFARVCEIELSEPEGEEAILF